MNWRKIRIGDFLHRVRIPVDIEDDQQYNLVTIRMHHKGVALRATKPGKEIGTKRMYTVQPGHFILSGIDARHGAFGIVPSELAGAVVTNDFWYFEVDDKQVDKELFLHLTSTSFFDDLCRIASDGTTNRVRLQADKFFNYEISLPPVEEQRELMAQLKHTNAIVTSVLTETDQQFTHLTQLRQALLREAMQGQLLPQDPTDEPATVLLQQLQAAKATTGKKGRGQAGVLFAEEAEAMEGPFEIPASWAWVQLDDVCAKIHFGLSVSSNPQKAEPKLLRITDIQGGKVDWPTVPGCDISDDEVPRFLLKENDILIARTGGTIGKSFLVRQVDVKSVFASYLIRIIPSAEVSAEYIKLFLESPMYWKQLYDAAWGAGQPNVNSTSLANLILPLPPVAEQRRIVVKLAQLLGHCDALEQRIRESRRLAEQLLATALREALVPPPVATLPAAAELELAEITQAPAHRSSRRGTQLALGTLLD